MATRTAPAVTGAISNYSTTIHLIDASGDVTTDNFVTKTAPTAAQIEAWVAAYQATSKASIYKVSTVSSWEGDADPQNADVGARNSIAQGVNLLYKNIATLNTQTLRLVAPADVTMQGDQDIPLVSATEFAALITATLAMLTGYNLVSAQYTERRERKNNPKIKV